MRRRQQVRFRLAAGRLARYVIVPVVMLAGVRWMWGLEAAHRVAATRAALQARGIPTDVEAFVTPEIPEVQNAVAPLLHAMGSWSLSSADRDLVEPPDGIYPAYRADYTPQELARVDPLLVSLAPLFADLDEAAARSGARWDPATQNPLDLWPRVGGRSALSFARLFNNAALLAVRRAVARNDRQAVFRHFHETLGVARIVDSSPTLIAHLVAIAIRSNAATALEYFLPSLHLTPADEPAARALIGELSDDQPARAAQLRAYHWEIAANIVAAQSELPLYQQWLLRPLAENQIDTLVQETAAFLPAAASPVWNPALVPAAARPPTHVLADVANLPYVNQPGYSRALLLHYRTLADCRAAAVLLAAKLYALDNPRAAPSLRDLAPYLDAPADPFSLADAPLHYRLDPAGPTVWSVGENGVDDGGVLPTLTKKHRRYDQADLVYGGAWRAFDDAFNASLTTQPAP